MIKQTTILLLATVLFTACAENGNTLQPASTNYTVKSTTDIDKNATRITDNNATKTITVQEINQTTEVNQKNNTMDLFNFSEETKQTLSGLSLILIAFLIIL